MQADLKTCNFIIKRLQQRRFFCEYCKMFTNTFSYRTTPVAASRSALKEEYLFTVARSLLQITVRFLIASHHSLFVSPCKNQSLLAAKSLVTCWKIIRSLLQKPLLALAKNHSSVVVKITCDKNHSSLITNITRYSLHINFTATFNLVSFDEEKWKTIYSHFSKIMSMLCFHAIATKRALHRILFSVL